MANHAKADPLKPISHSVTVDAPVERAFEIFTSRLGDWWPIAYTFSEGAFADATVEPRVGGRWLERTEDGRELSWGDVRTFERGRRIVVGFAIGADRKPTPPAAASEVEVRFVPETGTQSRVELEHRDFERHGEGAEKLRAGMASPQGWPLILAEFRRGVRRATTSSSARAR